MDFDCKSEEKKYLSLYSHLYIIPANCHMRMLCCRFACTDRAQLTLCVPEDALFMGVFFSPPPPSLRFLGGAGDTCTNHTW